MIRISVTSKLDGIRSWSLQARDTCPGAIGADACKGCYATQGNYRYPNVKAPRIENREDWKRDEWEDEMVKALDKDRYFRWFDSGDVYSLALAEKIHSVMVRTPWVKHWIPTRMGKFPKFAPVLSKMQSLPNVMVRFSSDSIFGEFDNRHGSTIFPTIAHVTKSVKPCLAYENEGKCSGCRSCWDKSVPVIGYIAHGKTMLKHVRIAMESIS